MNPFKSKEQKQEKKQEKLDELMTRNNLQNLSQEDKEKVKYIFNQQLNASVMRIGFDAADTAKTGLLDLIIEQNFMMIKLLNDISNKLN